MVRFLFQTVFQLQGGLEAGVIARRPVQRCLLRFREEMLGVPTRAVGITAELERGGGED